MQTNLFRHLARWALTTACLVTIATAATPANAATAGSFLRECAARDLQVLAMIDERAATGAVTPERLDQAMLTLMHARIVCHEGQVMDALAIYEDIARNMASNRTVTGREMPTEIH